MFKLTWKNIRLLIESLVIAILIVWMLTFVTSCVTEKKCNAKYPPSVTYVKKDSIVFKEKLVYRDTVVYKTLVKDSMIYNEKIIYSNDSIWFPPMEAKGKYGYAKSWAYNGRAFLKYFEGGMDIEFRLDNAIKEANYYKEQYTNEKTKEKVTYTINSPFAKFCIWFFFGIIGLTILAVVFVRIRK